MNALEVPFFEYADVRVFHVYQGNGSPLSNWFSWARTEFEGDDSCAQFDIRTLQGYQQPALGTHGRQEFYRPAHESPVLWELNHRDYQQTFFKEYIDRNLGSCDAPWEAYTSAAQVNTKSAPVRAVYVPDRRAMSAAAKTSTGIFRWLRSLVPAEAIAEPASGFVVDTLRPIASDPATRPGLSDEYIKTPHFQEYLRKHAKRVKEWEYILRPIVGEPEGGHDAPWWLHDGPVKALREISNPLPAMARRTVPPTHLIDELRHTDLRRALLLRQLRIDRKTVDRSRLWVIVQPEEWRDGRTYFGHYSVPNQDKRYHWAEIAASDNREEFLDQIRSGIDSATTQISVWMRYEVGEEHAKDFASWFETALRSIGFSGTVTF